MWHVKMTWIVTSALPMATCLHPGGYQMNSFIRGISVLLIGACLATGCSKATLNSVVPKDRRVASAPASESEVGVTADGVSAEDMTKLLASDPEIKVRVINEAHQLYEVYGSDINSIKNILSSSHATIEKNSYIDLRKTIEKTQVGFKTIITPQEKTPEELSPIAALIEQNQGVKLNDSSKSFLSSCVLNRMAMPKIQIIANLPADKLDSDRLYFELGRELMLDASGSSANSNVKSVAPVPLDFLWVLSGPMASKLGSKESIGHNLNFTPDALGPHLYTVVAKDQHGFCNLAVNAFYVTSNDLFNPTNALDADSFDKIDSSMFWHLFQIGSPSAWKTAAEGKDIAIGILDTGVDYNHVALSLNILLNPHERDNNCFDDDANGFEDDLMGYDFGRNDAFPFDDYGHGTHVAGIAASRVFGAGRKASILPLKINSGVGFDAASVAGAIKYGVDSGAKILNMSFTLGQDFQAVRDAINYAESKNVLIVVAAGNESSNNDLVKLYPQSYTNRNILTVAAVDEKNALTEYSNFGNSVHIAAPGGTADKPIVSSYMKNPFNVKVLGMSGTSMAAPLVAGAASQVWAARPQLTAVEVRQALLDYGKPVAALKGKVLSGKVIDVPSSLMMATKTSGLQ